MKSPIVAVNTKHLFSLITGSWEQTSSFWDIFCFPQVPSLKWRKHWVLCELLCFGWVTQVWWKSPLMCAGNRDTSVICATEWQELMNRTYRHGENNINEQRRRRDGEIHTFQTLNKEIKQACNKLLARHARQRHAERIRSLIRCHAESGSPAEICMYANMTLMFKIWSVKKWNHTQSPRCEGVKLSVSRQKCKAAGTLCTSCWYQTNDVWISWQCQITVVEKCLHPFHRYFKEIQVIFALRKTAIC